MKKWQNKIIIASVILVIIAIPYVVWRMRSPVIIVSEQSFSLLYGEKRLKKEAFFSSLILFRQVKPVIVADDVGEDLTEFAISEISKKPLCVIFPLRFVNTASSYREKNQEIPVVILEGRYNENENPVSRTNANINIDDYFIYKTDIESDFYMASLGAIAIDGGKNGKIAVLSNPNMLTQAQSVLLKMLEETNSPIQASFFTEYKQFTANKDISSVILAIYDAEFQDKTSEIPVIYMTWINPEYLPHDMVMVINDSPFVQAVDAVKMVKAGMKKGAIKSKPEVLKKSRIDKKTKKILRKLYKKAYL